MIVVLGCNVVLCGFFAMYTTMENWPSRLVKFVSLALVFANFYLILK